jgi:hypothetical protein
VKNATRWHSGWEKEARRVSGTAGEVVSTYNQTMLSSRLVSERRDVKRNTLALALCVGSLFLASCSSGGPSLRAPENLTVISVENSVELSWEDRSDNEVGFAIYRKLESEASFTRINQTPANTQNYTDTNLSSTTNYLYKVTAVAANNAESEASVSEAVSATKLGAPSNVSATAGEGKIDVTWADNSSVEEGFRIFRKLESEASFPSEAVTVGANVTSYSDTAVSAGSTYVYQVVAFVGENTSDASSVSAPATPASALVVDTLEGEWRGTLQDVGNVELSADEDLDGGENTQRNNARFTLLNDQTRFIFECNTTGAAIRCTEFDRSGEDLGDNGNVITATFTAKGKISGTFKRPSEPAQTLTLERFVITTPAPTPAPTPTPAPVVDTLEGEWRGTLQGVGNVELSADADLDSAENTQRNNARFTYLNADQTRFIFECTTTGADIRCTEIDLGTGEDLGDSGFVITGKFTVAGTISGTFKNPFQSSAQTLTLERVSQ